MSHLYAPWLQPRTYNNTQSYSPSVADTATSNTCPEYFPNLLQPTNADRSLDAFSSSCAFRGHDASYMPSGSTYTASSHYPVSTRGNIAQWKNDMEDDFDTMGMTSGYSSSPVGRYEYSRDHTRVRTLKHSHSGEISPYPLSNEDRTVTHVRSTTQEQAVQLIRSPTVPIVRQNNYRYKPCRCCRDEVSPDGPTNYVLVSQAVICDAITTRPEQEPRYRSITFQMVNFPEFGVRIGQAREMYPPKIEAGGEAVLSMCDREIKICIQWPGYGGKCFQRRTKTQRGKVTRDVLLLVIANTIMEYMELLKTKEVIPGNEEWAIGQLPDGRPGIQGEELFITRLIHRGGSNWQPEIWAPKIIG